MRPGIYPDLSWSGRFNRAVRTFQIVVFSVLFGGLVGGAGVFAVTRLLTDSSPPRPDIRIGAPAMTETSPAAHQDVSPPPQPPPQAQEPIADAAAPQTPTIAPAAAQPANAQSASAPAGSAALSPSQAGQPDFAHLYDRGDAAQLEQGQTAAKPSVAHIKKPRIAASRHAHRAMIVPRQDTDPNSYDHRGRWRHDDWRNDWHNSARDNW